MAAHWLYASCVDMCWTDELVSGLEGTVNGLGLGVCCMSSVDSDSVVEKETLALSAGGGLTSTSDVSKVMLTDVGCVILGSLGLQISCW